MVSTGVITNFFFETKGKNMPSIEPPSNQKERVTIGERRL